MNTNAPLFKQDSLFPVYGAFTIWFDKGANHILKGLSTEN